MGFLDPILGPLYTAVSWIIVQFHSLYSQFFNPDGGWAWGLAIVSLVILVRACMIPLTIKQTKSMRAMQALQPRLKVIQDRYKGDRQKLAEEQMKLYKEAGANPASSCLPLLIQSPFFMSLYGVLSNVAHGKTVGVINQTLLNSATKAHIFGAPLSASFVHSTLTSVKIVTAIMILTMCFTQFLTTRQLMTKNVDLTVKTPYMQQQKMMMYVFPVIYIFFGINMPVGVLIYMVTSNLWTLGQQLVIIRQNPTPGSIAFKQRQERLKAAGKLNADGTPVKAGLASLVKGGSAPVQLENPDPPVYLLQSGLTGPAGAAYPSHLAMFESASTDYRLGSAAELRVPLTWSEHGVTVTKTYILRRGEYAIGLNYEVHNGTDSPYEVRPYAQLLREDPRTKSSYFHVESYAFHGPAIYDGTKYRKLDPTSAEDSRLSLEVRDGWLAALQHHFVSAIVPPRGVPWQFTLGVSGSAYLLGGTGPQVSIAPGDSAQFSQTLFTGPKLQSQLAAVSPELGRVADYGRLWVLAWPLFWLLARVHALTGNWGIAIILVTFLLKLLFYPLSEASGRSMAKMKTLQPRIKNLQETYKDDREKLGRAMMELYQREKVNPVAGCLPIVIQIPVFIAFYWVLLESVEMRQAPFAFWIHDLSSRDPLFILPLIMAVAMFVQYRLNPAPPDPVQAKVFMIMPIVMSATFAFFPSGLVLYWVTNTILSIAQQWNINRRIEAAAAARRAN